MGLQASGGVIQTNAIIGASQAAATRYVGLHSADPGATGANELSGNGYARAAIAHDVYTVNSTTGAGENSSAVTFPLPTATWADITHIAMYTAATGGTPIWTKKITGDPMPPRDGSVVSLPASMLDVVPTLVVDEP